MANRELIHELKLGENYSAFKIKKKKKKKKKREVKEKEASPAFLQMGGGSNVLRVTFHVQRALPLKRRRVTSQTYKYQNLVPKFHFEFRQAWN